MNAQGEGGVRPRFVPREVDGLFRVYDQGRGSFPYTTPELGVVMQDVPKHVATSEAERLNAWVTNGVELARGQHLLRPNSVVERDDDPPHEEITSDRPSGDGLFVPARDKREAVGRISAWTGGPEAVLGPGSTERKSVISRAATFAGLAASDLDLSKPDLARVVVEHLGGSWDSTCFSSGSTVTLVGLNRLLKALESRTESSSTGAGSPTPGDEARLLLTAVVRHTPRTFDGREAVTSMREAESSDWAKSEWPGFYFEFVALGPCMAAVDGGPVPTNTRTVFDLGGAFVWDFKAHSSAVRWAILNDQSATQWVLAERGGLGLVILTGEPSFDADFKQWLDEEKARHGKTPPPRSRPAKYQRRLKSTFTPERVDIIYLTADDWKRAVLDDIVRPWAQPQQPGGQARNPKYQVNVARAADRWGLASASL